MSTSDVILNTVLNKTGNIFCFIMNLTLDDLFILFQELKGDSLNCNILSKYIWLSDYQDKTSAVSVGQVINSHLTTNTVYHSYLYHSKAGIKMRK